MDGESEIWTGTAADFVPRTLDLPQLRQAAANCRGCDLHARGQVQFGEGPAEADIVMVGEQPEVDTIQGQLSYGSGRQLLEESLARVGVERHRVYITPLVKHPKIERQNRHWRVLRPNEMEIEACQAWLWAELLTVEPKGLVAMGRTAARSLLGTHFNLSLRRGQIINGGRMAAVNNADAAIIQWVMATDDPARIAALRDERKRWEAGEALIRDLRVVARMLPR